MAQAKRKGAVVEATDDSVDTITEYSEDVSNAQKPEPLPERDYIAEIKAVEKKANQAGDGEYYQVSFLIPEQEFPADYPAENAPGGKTIIYRRVSAKDTVPNRWRLRKWLESIGAPGGKRIDHSKWIGLHAKVTVEHREWEDSMVEDITKVQAVN